MTLQRYISGAINIVDILIMLLMGAGFLVFLWGLAKFITKAGDTAAVEQGKNTMVWGIIALFVMTCVWGIVKFIAGELEVSVTGGSLPIQSR